MPTEELIDEAKRRGWLVGIDPKVRFSENGAHAGVVADLLEAAGVEAQVDDRWVSIRDGGLGILLFARLEDNNLVLVQPMGEKRSGKPNLALILGAARQIAETAGTTRRFACLDAASGKLAALPGDDFARMQTDGQPFHEPTGEGPRPLKPSEAKRFREI